MVTFRPTLAKVITRLKERLCRRNPESEALVTVFSLYSLASQITGFGEVISAARHEELIKIARRQIHYHRHRPLFLANCGETRTSIHMQ
jgi:hypothetical protein